MSDIGITVAVDDAALRASLRRVEGQVVGTFGEISKRARDRFSGVFELQSTLQRFSGLATSALTGFGAFTAVSGVVSMMQSYRDEARRAAEEAVREAEARRDILMDLSAGMRALDRLGGGPNSGGDLGAQLDSIRENANRLREIARKARDTHPNEKSVYTRGFAGMVYDNALLDIARREEDALNRAREEAALRAEMLATEAKIAGIRAGGATLVADQLAEYERHQAALRTAERVRDNGDLLRHQRLVEAERERHEAVMGAIRREHGAREAADIDRQRQEDVRRQEARERDAANAADIEAMQSIELAKAMGDTRRVKMLEVQYGLRRGLSAIQGLDVSETEKMRLAEREREIAAARMLDGPPGTASGRGGIAAAVSGIINRGAATVQLGGASAPALRAARENAESARKTAENTREAADNLRAMREDLKRFAGRGAVVA